ncbi:hypothetical protein OCU04_008601 [Sclerotinia nivalis]|nr:hypothetical protein OCU04_008601 [Sclerotinia nivalis]
MLHRSPRPCFEEIPHLYISKSTPSLTSRYQTSQNHHPVFFYNTSLISPSILNNKIHIVSQIRHIYIQNPKSNIQISMKYPEIHNRIKYHQINYTSKRMKQRKDSLVYAMNEVKVAWSDAHNDTNPPEYPTIASYTIKQ